MFKNAVKKLSGIPALARSSRFQPLQEFISPEELVLHSYVRCGSTVRDILILTFPRFQSPGVGRGLGQNI